LTASATVSICKGQLFHNITQYQCSVGACPAPAHAQEALHGCHMPGDPLSQSKASLKQNRRSKLHNNGPLFPGSVSMGEDRDIGSFPRKRPGRGAKLSRICFRKRLLLLLFFCYSCASTLQWFGRYLILQLMSISGRQSRSSHFPMGTMTGHTPSNYPRVSISSE
jgi:hypothetical protein